MLEHIPELMAIGFEMEQPGSVMANLFSNSCQIFFGKDCSSLPVMPTPICQCKTWHRYKHFVIIGLDNGKALCNLSCLLNVCAIQYCQPSCHHPSKGLFCFLKCYTNTKNLAQKKYVMSTLFFFSFPCLQRIKELLSFTNQISILYILSSAQQLCFSLTLEKYQQNCTGVCKE